MDNRETNLRQGNAILEAEGLLSEKNLEKAVVNGQEVIKGTMVLQVGELNFLTVNVYVGSKKRDGTDNQAYSSMVTIMDTYRSIADVGKADATLVSIKRGQIVPNTYYDPQGQQRYKVQYRNTYFNTVRNPDDFEPKAEFEVEMVISNLRPEVYTSGEHQGEESGRLLVDGWLPTYDGIEPMHLIAPAEDGIADAIAATYEVGQTVDVVGEIVNRRVEQVREIQVLIGKPKIEKTSYEVNELVITGISAPYEEDPVPGQEAAYNLDTIRAAIAVRDEKLAEKKQNATKPASQNQPISRPTTTTNRNLPF